MNYQSSYRDIYVRDLYGQTNGLGSVGNRRSNNNVYASLGLPTTANPTNERIIPTISPSDGYTFSSASKTSSSPTEGTNYYLKIFVLLCVIVYSATTTFNLSTKKLTTMTKDMTASLSLNKIMNALDDGAEEEDEEEHEFDAGIMVLGPPYDKFRHVVMDLPVSESDVTFLWSFRGNDAQTIRDALSDCFNIEFVTLSSPAEILEMNPSVYHRSRGVFSPDIREVGARWSEESRGRMFAFFRHPFTLWLDKQLQQYQEGPGNEKIEVDNVMVRTLIGDFDMKLTFKELGMAKKIIREKCVPGLVDEQFFRESFRRIVNYFGWDEVEGSACTDRYLSTIEMDPFSEFTEETNDGSKEWKTFASLHNYDLQLYEFVRSDYRAHYQTIIPLSKQYKFYGEEEEDESE